MGRFSISGTDKTSASGGNALLAAGRFPSAVSSLWVYLALAVAAVLRFAVLGQKALWCDELASVQRLNLTFVRHLLSMRGNHPLYELLLRFWASPEASDAWLRIPSAVLGVLAVWMTWLVIRGLGRAEALVAAWLMALSPLHVMYSRIARPYTLAVALALASNLAFVWAIRRRRFLPLAAYVVATTLMVYANLAAGSLWVAQGVFLLWFYRRRLRRLGPWLAANGCVALLLAPWMWYSFRTAFQWSDETQYTAQQEGLLAKMGYQAFTLCLGETVNPLNRWIVPIAALGFGGAVAMGVLWALRRRSRQGLFLLTQVLVVYAAGLYVSAAAAKHLAIVLPAWLGLMAVSLVRSRVRWFRWGVGAILVLTTGASLFNYFAGREFADADMVTPWRDMARAVRRSEHSGDGLIIGYRMDRGAYDMFRRYYRGDLEPKYLDFQRWREHLAREAAAHRAVWMLLHDGDPWREVEAWLHANGFRFEVMPIQWEEHTLERIREQGLFGPGGKEYYSYLYRLYRILRPPQEITGRRDVRTRPDSSSP